MDNIIVAAIQLGVAIAAFVVGKYVFPNIPKSVTEKLNTLGQWASQFVVWAKEFMKSSTGEEKMTKVVEKLKEIADEAGLKVTEDQLKAIAQAAYEAMKAGEKEAVTAQLETAAIAPATTVVINTTAATVSTEKVAVATDNVPEGAAETNADGTVNVYDAAGNIVGSVTEQEAEKMAADVTKIVDGTGNEK